MTTLKRVWFITGSSTGFGRALAEAMLEKGELVFATARKPEQLNAGWLVTLPVCCYGNAEILRGLR